ncbi:MAG: peptidoglycan editing factor PgeF [Bacilli bacterium]|nr:peptidoglycan editing factor PgeF [Bacilli bacterium]
MNENKRFITFNKLNEFDDLIHFYTKRPFNLNESKLEEEYKTLEDMASYKFDKIYLSKQTHSANICSIDDDTPLILDNIDGFVTNKRGVAILTKSADCQSILLYDPVNKVIGNVHSGWKGTLAKIITNAINIMICEYNCNPKNIIACICPSILKCCFEVDEDLIEGFKMVHDNIDDLITKGDIINGKQKYYLDTVTINKREMIKLGLLEENIVLSNICTKCNSDIFNSYRAEHNSCRNVALIGLKK